MAQAANPAVVLPLNQERRRHQRVKVVLNGRFMLLDRREFDCQTVNMSPGGALLTSATLPHIGDPVVAYIDHVGRLEGRCVRHLPNSFAMTVTGTIRRREKLADQLTWFANRAKLGLPEDRRHERFPLKDPRSTLTLPNGLTVPCRVIDVSLSGAAVSAEVVPPLGSPVSVGRTPARVVRHIDGGFAVEFSRVQTAEVLERELSPDA
jgi:PilZ domain